MRRSKILAIVTKTLTFRILMTSAEFSALLQGHEGRRCVCRTVTAWARPDNEVLQLSAGNDVSWSADGQFQAVQQIPAPHFLFSASLLQLFACLRFFFPFRLCDRTLGRVRISTHVTPTEKCHSDIKISNETFHFPLKMEAIRP